MAEKQIFFDPHRKRWKRLRRVIDAVAVVTTLVVAGFVFNSLRGQPLPELLLPTPRHNYRALDYRTYRGPHDRTPLLKNSRPGMQPRRKSSLKPADIPLNTGEGVRAAYYVPYDATSYSSFKEHVRQIDLLFPEWLHVDAPNGVLLAMSSENTLHEYPIVDNGTVHDPDDLNKIKHVIQDTRVDTQIFPHLNNFNPHTQKWDPAIGDVLADDSKRALLEGQIMRFFTALPAYAGLSLDFENLRDTQYPIYMTFVGELYAQMHPRNLRLYVTAGVSTQDAYLKQLAANSDGIVLMNYDQHEVESDPGPIAAQSWFIANLQRAKNLVPLSKLICAVGNYGYDWTMSIPQPVKRRHGRKARLAKPQVVNTEDLSVSDVWQRASDADADLNLDYDTLNPHFEYIDEDANQRHVVWFLDGVTVLNELRGARELGFQTFALWRLGEEDASLWNVWDKPSSPAALQALGAVQPGHDVDTEGEGEIIRVTGLPKSGKRTVEIDSDEPDPRKKLIIDEHMDVYPNTYIIQQYGYHPGEVALSFDDGPDPKWTPRILDVLKRKGAHATFMMIGEEAQQHIALMQRVVREGNEIGNHTFTHPDISEISQRQLDWEVNLTDRLFAAKLGVQPLYFRPPYDIDEEPDTDDQSAPVVRIQALGLTTIGNKIDTNDWDERVRKSPQEIAQSVLDQLNRMKTSPQFRGSVILLHDGGGERSVTVAALPVLIDTLRAHGYKIVQVSELMGKTTADVMPKLSFWQQVRTWPDSVAFSTLSIMFNFIVFVFFIGDVLMSARLILVGIFAIVDRLRRPHRTASPGFNPRVAVLVPSFNEEKVIVRTIRSVLNSDYDNLRVIVIDDGSNDRTADVARDAYAAEIRAGRVQVLEKPNGGKAAALNFALNLLDEEIYVGIDADTVIAADAISKLIPHFEDREIGAVAGNAKVGNRVNLWTRWQALEYITSQNFERRALDLFNVVTVVPGAIGAWRTEAVKKAGCYPVNTVAEDADLTMSLLEQGLKVVYEDRSLAFTEAPIDARGLMRQRFRWSFGTLQAVWKHRAAFVRNKAMGLFALPNILIFQMLLPLVSPFIDIMFVYGIFHYFIDRHYHPEAASAANFQKLLVYFLAFLVIDFFTSMVAFSLERRHPANKGDGWLLFHIWLQRFSYRQLFSVVLFKTLKRAIDGKPFNWDKLERTARMSKRTEALTETR
ncbi:MAG TPA: glycosyltransferase [Terracidiphilus sp.]|jgi:cellulose synthase/poly-beta-1,6-N-acetylglucosamine synthase-like glycosyltransferase/peptidoglycan/xylan/chitin deacetylase (PgdA/CDA1 family)/spore germination protein YaaH|nr:glycosyltransferase [Terracidiphilus sp.]